MPNLKSVHADSCIERGTKHSVTRSYRKITNSALSPQHIVGYFPITEPQRVCLTVQQIQEHFINITAFLTDIVFMTPPSTGTSQQ